LIELEGDSATGFQVLELCIGLLQRQIELLGCYLKALDLLVSRERSPCGKRCEPERYEGDELGE
jgi:hypothetical protein